MWRKYGMLIVAALAGLLLFWIINYVPPAEDEAASATHTLDRAGAEDVAVRFVAERVSAKTPLTAFAMYTAERDVFGYLYREKALDAVLERFHTMLPLETYKVEVKDTVSGAVHLVDINPYTGEPAEWDLRLAGEPVPREELEAIGAAMLTRLNLTGLAVASLTEADESSGEITYALGDPAWLEARGELTVRADALGVNGVSVRWSAPASYTGLIAEQDGRAATLGFLGLTLSALLQLGAMIFALVSLREVRFSRGIVMAIAFGLLYCAININMIPGLKATLVGVADGGDYAAGGEGTLAGMISMLLVSNAFTLMLAAGLYFSLIAGDTLARRQQWNVWPHRTNPGYGPHVAAAVGKGYLFAFVLLGMQSLIYYGAESGFRTWFTIDALMSAHNMLDPLLLPLLAWCAAVSEEGVYRLLAIPALTGLLKFPLQWLFPRLGLPASAGTACALVAAVVVSSMVWALGHVQYPTYPYYTRFVEVTLIGFLFAYIFLKHGFLTAVFAHAVVDVIWMGLSIAGNGANAAHWTALALYFASPALIGLAVRRFHRRLPHAPPSGAG